MLYRGFFVVSVKSITALTFHAVRDLQSRTTYRRIFNPLLSGKTHYKCYGTLSRLQIWKSGRPRGCPSFYQPKRIEATQPPGGLEMA